MVSTNIPDWQTQISADGVTFTHPEIMAKMIATIDPEGFPHLTMITSNKAISPSIVKWGEFTRGLSKKYVKENPKQGVLYMTALMPFKFLQAKIHFHHLSREGDDAVDFNMMHLFRYNTYMRIYTTYFNDVIAARPIRDISLMGITKGILWNLFNHPGKTGSFEQRLSPLGCSLFIGPINPKFISYIDTDGYPIIFPAFQARAIEGKRILVPMTQFGGDIQAISDGAKVSVFAMDMETVSQMTKGILLEKNSKYAVIDITSVYNSMPPKMGEIYPHKQTRPKITNFV
jgi:hypothetical protein